MYAGRHLKTRQKILTTRHKEKSNRRRKVHTGLFVLPSRSRLFSRLFWTHQKLETNSSRDQSSLTLSLSLFYWQQISTTTERRKLPMKHVTTFYRRRAIPPIPKYVFCWNSRGKIGFNKPVVPSRGRRTKLRRLEPRQITNENVCGIRRNSLDTARTSFG